MRLKFSDTDTKQLNANLRKRESQCSISTSDKAKKLKRAEK